MIEQKPETVEQYKKWLKDELKTNITNRHKTHYDSVTKNVRTDFENSDFWTELIKNLKEYNDEYHIKNKYDLIPFDFKPEVLIKEYDRFFQKIFRKNILDRENWSTEPDSGWILPDNWFTKINDSIRTEIVVKYLDGIEFIKDKIESLCKKYRQDCETTFEARLEGYYAFHINTSQMFEIPKMNYDTEIVKIPIEIQITTQLQEVIRKLLHKYYKEKRKQIEKNSKDWMWDYECDEFATNYLGHILHYVEGMIMEVRKKQEGKI